MNSLLKIVGMVGLVCLASCAKTVEEPSGTNTNWLRTCDETSDCAGDDVCVCGQCTQACTASSQCGSVHEEARCEPVDDDVCGASVGIASACLQRCSSDDDCTALRDGRCSSGLCVPAPREPIDGGGARKDGGITSTTQDGGLERRGESVVIPDAYKSCAQHDECVLVEPQCSSCCGLDSIRSSLFEVFQERMLTACEGYMGGICDCEYDNRVPRCVEGRCRAVLRDEADCFGPEANPELGDAPDAIGCSCPRLDMIACAGTSVTLQCEASHRGVGWSLSDNEICSDPPPPPCGATQTIEDCAAGADVCYLQPDGGYCGISFPEP